jgi:hypothetical protein
MREMPALISRDARQPRRLENMKNMVHSRGLNPARS